MKMPKDYTKTEKDLAFVIMNMSFGTLMGVAYQLVAMNKEIDDPEMDRHADTPVGLAQTLYDWAEAQD